MKKLVLLLLCLVPLCTFADEPQKVMTILRSKRIVLLHFPADGPKILFAPGDAGFHGFAKVLGMRMANAGYDVYGIDSKHYLESFTAKKSRLTERDVMNDFAELAARISRGKPEKLTLVGWSEGAGLCLLAAAGENNAVRFNGFIAIGISELSELGWRWIDFITYITKKDPREPMFRTADFLPTISPLPFVMMQSTRDLYISAETAEKLFSIANEPKRFLLIEAKDHHFKGNQEEFFQELFLAVDWIDSNPH